MGPPIVKLSKKSGNKNFCGALLKVRKTGAGFLTLSQMTVISHYVAIPYVAPLWFETLPKCPHERKIEVL